MSEDTLVHVLYFWLGIAIGIAYCSWSERRLWAKYLRRAAQSETGEKHG